MTLSGQVRELVVAKYVEPAGRAAKPMIRVSVNDVSRDLEWRQRFPLICSALTARSFHRDMGIELVGTTTPCPSSTTILTFKLV